jgi:hypothetical protein
MADYLPHLYRGFHYPPKKTTNLSGKQSRLKLDGIDLGLSRLGMLRWRLKQQAIFMTASCFASDVSPKWIMPCEVFTGTGVLMRSARTEQSS